MAIRSRPPLTRERILDAALALADRDGIDGLSMRRLGQEVGVEAMSLYNHVANKDDVLDGVLELVAAEFDVDPSGAGWRERARALAISARDALVRHPWAASLMASHVGQPGAHRLRYTDSLLAILEDGGFSDALTYHGYHTLDTHIKGYAYQQVVFPMGDEELEEKGRQFLEMLPHDEYPALARHVAAHLDGAFEDHRGFEFGLDLLLDGLERLREAAG